MRHTLVMLFIYWLGSVPVFAQKTQDNKATTQPAAMFALGTSMIAYSGELSNYASFSAMFHGRLVQTRSRRLNPAIEMGWGKLTGNNLRYVSAAGTPNRSFNTSFFQLAAHAQFNIIKKPQQRLYISQGLGLMRFNPMNDRDNRLLDQPNTRAPEETYGNFTLLLPTAIGGTYHFPNHLGIGMEVGLMNTRTDYLDNISQLGNPEQKDNVLRVQFSVIAPLTYDSPDSDAARKERLANKREEIRLKKQREKEAFEKLKKQPKGSNAQQGKQAPAKKKQQQKKKPKLFGIF